MMYLLVSTQPIQYDNKEKAVETQKKQPSVVDQSLDNDGHIKNPIPMLGTDYILVRLILFRQDQIA